MKKYVKGEYIEMTAEEIAEMKEQALAEDNIGEMPTVLERLEAIEAAILEGVLLSD